MDANGKILESVKFITHSQGTATQRGFSQALMDYVNNLNNSVNEHNEAEFLLEQEAARRGETYTPNFKKGIVDFKIEYTVDISAFQGDQLDADQNSDDNYYMRNSDPLSIWVGPNPSTQKIDGSKELGLDGKGNPKARGHHAANFDYRDLPKDKDKVDTNNTIEYGNE